MHANLRNVYQHISYSHVSQLVDNVAICRGHSQWNGVTILPCLCYPTMENGLPVEIKNKISRINKVGRISVKWGKYKLLYDKTLLWDTIDTQRHFTAIHFKNNFIYIRSKGLQLHLVKKYPSCFYAYSFLSETIFSPFLRSLFIISTTYQVHVFRWENIFSHKIFESLLYWIMNLLIYDQPTLA